MQEYLPVKRRQNAKGWWTFDAPCCDHRGHNRDTRGRGNFLASTDGTMRANCYNCGFKAKYSGGDISKNFEAWMVYLGVPREKIQQAKLEILSKKLSGELEIVEKQEYFKAENFPEIELPAGSRPISEWLQDQHPPDEMIKCVEYLAGRGRAVAENWDYHWAPNFPGLAGRRILLNHRVIIPFKHRGKIVGWTGRYHGKPPSGISKYHNSDVPPGYLFNPDAITAAGRKFVLITEGPFDAIAIDGVAALGSTLNGSQIAWLNSTDKEKIVVPDLQAKNQDLIDFALNQGWSVSFPEWEEKVKDAAEASQRYGRLYTLHSILAARTDSQLKIGIKRQMLKG